MKRSRIAPTVLLAMLAGLGVGAGAQEWGVDWQTIDGGGEIAAEGGDWTLSGTIGQWDATPNAKAAVGPWELTGGFWGVNLETDVLFKDGYEG